VRISPQVLREYALLADGERGALIGPHGAVVWMCLPRWDSDAVFSELVGGGGAYLVAPDGHRFVWGGHYEEGTLIWRSRWVTETGIVECREALSWTGDPNTAVLLRRIEALRGAARVRVVLDPRADWGRSGMSHLERHGGHWTATCGPLALRWLGGEQAEVREGRLECVLELAEGARHDLLLELSTGALDDAPPLPSTAWDATAAAWARDVPELNGVIGQRDARHAYAVLRGLTSASGGMVAAATTSLPERAGTGRNYDYRYVWIRDQCFAGLAVAAAGAYPLLDDAVSFTTARVLADGPALRPAYRVDGGPVPAERSLPHLAGYPGGVDRVGNWVGEKFQLDTFGQILQLLAAAERCGRLDLEHWHAAETCVAAIEKHRREPDQGIWELGDGRWAHSRLACVAGLRAIAGVAPQAQAASWTALADSVLADVAADCTHPSGRWQRCPTDDRVDAALLLPAIRGAVAPDDPRHLATLAAVRDELTVDGFVYRYRHDDRPLSEAEGAFLLCGVLTALAYAQQGDAVSALRAFERNRTACGPPALLSEEYDIVQHQLRGNLPQAFVHAALLESACWLREHA
jgi:GH15 family glucan-1,4-alpha-glucosidase